MAWMGMLIAAGAQGAAGNQMKQGAKGMKYQTEDPTPGEQAGGKVMGAATSQFLKENTGAPQRYQPTMSEMLAGQGKYGGLAESLVGSGDAYAPAASVQSGGFQYMADTNANLRNILAGDEARKRAIGYKLQRKANLLGDQEYYNLMRSKSLYDRAAMTAQGNQMQMGAWGQLGQALGYGGKDLYDRFHKPAGAFPTQTLPYQNQPPYPGTPGSPTPQDNWDAPFGP